MPTDIHEVSPYNYLNHDTPSYRAVTTCVYCMHICAIDYIFAINDKKNLVNVI